MEDYRNEIVKVLRSPSNSVREAKRRRKRSRIKLSITGLSAREKRAATKELQKRVKILYYTKNILIDRIDHPENAPALKHLKHTLGLQTEVEGIDAHEMHHRALVSTRIKDFLENSPSTEILGDDIAKAFGNLIGITNFRQGDHNFNAIALSRHVEACHHHIKFLPPLSRDTSNAFEGVPREKNQTFMKIEMNGRIFGILRDFVKKATLVSEFKRGFNPNFKEKMFCAVKERRGQPVVVGNKLNRMLGLTESRPARVDCYLYAHGKSTAFFKNGSIVNCVYVNGVATDVKGKLVMGSKMYWGYLKRFETFLFGPQGKGVVFEKSQLVYTDKRGRDTSIRWRDESEFYIEAGKIKNRGVSNSWHIYVPHANRSDFILVNKPRKIYTIVAMPLPNYVKHELERIEIAKTMSKRERKTKARVFDATEQMKDFHRASGTLVTNTLMDINKHTRVEINTEQYIALGYVVVKNLGEIINILMYEKPTNWGQRFIELGLARFGIGTKLFWLSEAMTETVIVKALEKMKLMSGAAGFAFEAAIEVAEISLRFALRNINYYYKYEHVSGLLSPRRRRDYMKRFRDNIENEKRLYRNALLFAGGKATTEVALKLIANHFAPHVGSKIVDGFKEAVGLVISSGGEFSPPTVRTNRGTSAAYWLAQFSPVPTCPFDLAGTNRNKASGMGIGEIDEDFEHVLRLEKLESQLTKWQNALLNDSGLVKKGYLSARKSSKRRSSKRRRSKRRKSKRRHSKRRNSKRRKH